jgi:hypothetical protein
MAYRPRALLLTPLLAGMTAAQEKEPQLAETLTAKNLVAWRDHIRSEPKERDWAELPWLMTFHDGLLAAAKAKKPLLLWTMNGHPFGCT